MTAEQRETRIAWALTYRLAREARALCRGRTFDPSGRACALGVADLTKVVVGGFNTASLDVAMKRAGITELVASNIRCEHDNGAYDTVQAALDALAEEALTT